MNPVGVSGKTSGMRGVFLVAAELARRDLTVSLTSRNARGADLLVTDQSCNRAFSVEVKTNRKRSKSWLLNKNAQSLKARSHIYVLVNLHDDLNEVEYYVVPSAVVATNMTKKRRPRSVWCSIKIEKVRKYRDKWNVFGGTNTAGAISHD